MLLEDRPGSQRVREVGSLGVKHGTDGTGERGLLNCLLGFAICLEAIVHDPTMRKVHASTYLHDQLTSGRYRN